MSKNKNLFFFRGYQHEFLDLWVQIIKIYTITTNYWQHLQHLTFQIGFFTFYPFEWIHSLQQHLQYGASERKHYLIWFNLLYHLIEHRGHYNALSTDSQGTALLKFCNNHPSFTKGISMIHQEMPFLSIEASCMGHITDRVVAPSIMWVIVSCLC